MTGTIEEDRPYSTRDHKTMLLRNPKPNDFEGKEIVTNYITKLLIETYKYSLNEKDSDRKQ